MPKFPEWIQPMAATLTQERFTGPEWIFERKFDGIRLLAYKRGAKVELFSRNRLPQNIPALAQAIAKLPHRELILDGEIDWHALSGTHASSRAAYQVFDILWLDGRDVRELPLEERQSLLKKLPLKPPLHRVTALKDSALAGEPPWERAQREGWEGVIAKRRGSIYEPRRSPNWLKMKVEMSQEFVVGGFTDPQGKRVGLGALLVGYYDYASVSDPDFSSPSGRGRVRVRSLATGSVSVPRAVAGSKDNLASKSEPPAIAGGPVSISSPSGRGRVRVRSLAGGSGANYDASETRLSSPSGRGRVRVRSLATGSSDTPDAAERERRSSSTSEGASRSAQPDFVFAGKIGTGFDNAMLLDLRAQLDKLEIPKPPFTKAIGLPRLRAHWVHPEIVVQVGFIQWTKYNKLRHPRLLAIRHDKSPREVVRE